MSILRKDTKKAIQKGFFLVELMVGLAIIGTVLLFAASLSKTSDAKVGGAESGQQLIEFTAEASKFYKTNRAVIDAAMTDGTAAAQWCKIGLAADGSGGTQANSVTKHTCAFDASLMKAKGLFNVSLSTGTRESSYVAIFRQLYDTASPPVATGASEAIFVLTPKSGALDGVIVTPEMSDEIISARTAMGGVGGMVPAGDFAGCVASRTSATFQVCGTSWKVNLTDYIDPPQLATFAASLPN